MESRKVRLTARRKFEVYLATRQKDANIGEILRRYGLHLNDLRSIESQVEQAALQALKGRRWGERITPTATNYSALIRELSKKEQALADMAAEYTLLKKSNHLGLGVPGSISTFMVRGGAR